MGANLWTLLLLPALLILVLALTGCPQRQEIIEQTVGAKAQDVVAEAEAGYVPEELLTWELVQLVDPGFEEATAVSFDETGALYVGGDQGVRKMATDGQVEWELPVGGEPTCLRATADVLHVGLRDRIEYYTGGQKAGSLVPDGRRTWITSFAFTGSDTFVADAGNRRILRYDSTGAVVGDFAGMDQERGIPPIAVPSPHLDIAIVPGNLLSGDYLPSVLVVANPGHRSIQYHSLEEGALLKSWGESSNGLEGFGGCCNPTDIALMSDGRVVTSEKGLPRVKVYSEDGSLLSVVVPPGDFLPNTVGIDLAVDEILNEQTGEVAPRIAVLDPERDVVRLYEEKAAAQETADQ